MPLLESVLLKMRLSQPFQQLLNELLLLLLIGTRRCLAA